MTKRKYRVFIDITLIMLCLFPLISLLFVLGTSSTILTAEQIANHIEGYAISNNMVTQVQTVLNNVGFNADGVFFAPCCTIITNAVFIYIFYVFVSVLVFVPKMAIKLLNIFSGGKVNDI